MRPHGRSQESEADYMGLIFSSLSGYDINESVRVWKRMNKKLEKKNFQNF
jgi:predicted Zn-dependent protease